MQISEAKPQRDVKPKGAVKKTQVFFTAPYFHFEYEPI